jgi:hypothetical protein
MRASTAPSALLPSLSSLQYQYSLQNALFSRRIGSSRNREGKHVKNTRSGYYHYTSKKVRKTLRSEYKGGTDIFGDYRK